MNETLVIIIPIIIAVVSTLLARPTFWKICFKKMPLPEDSTPNIITCMLFCQIFVGAFLFIILFIGLINDDLVFFNGFTISAIVALIVNICLGNFAFWPLNWSAIFKRKNVLISCCVLVVFSILTIVLNVQFEKVTVPTTKTEAESLETILEDESIAIERKDLLALANTDLSSFEAYASNGKIIYWDANSERKVNTAIILQGNKCFVKRYDRDYPSFLESHKEIGYVVNDENHLYLAFAIIKYKDLHFYVDHYTLYDYENDELIECKNLPTWATNK